MAPEVYEGKWMKKKDDLLVIESKNQSKTSDIVGGIPQVEFSLSVPPLHPFHEVLRTTFQVNCEAP